MAKKFLQTESPGLLTNEISYLTVLIISLTGLIHINFAFSDQIFTDVRYWKNNLFHGTISANNLKEKFEQLLKYDN